MIKGILIDPGLQLITEIELKNKTVDLSESLEDILRGHFPMRAYTLFCGDELYLDQDGMMYERNLSFEFPGLPPVFGRAVIIGTDGNGQELKTCRLKVDFLQRVIKFYNKAESDIYRDGDRQVGWLKPGVN